MRKNEREREEKVFNKKLLCLNINRHWGKTNLKVEKISSPDKNIKTRKRDTN